MVNLTVNGQPVAVPEGAVLLEELLKHGAGDAEAAEMAGLDFHSVAILPLVLVPNISARLKLKDLIWFMNCI